MNIKQTDLIKDIMAKYGLSQDDANRFVKTMFAVIREGVETDGIIKVKTLGTFKVSSVNARESVDVNTGERIVIEGRSKITFAPDVILRDRVNSPFAQFETVPLNDGVDFTELEAQQDTDENSDDDDKDDDEDTARIEREANTVGTVDIKEEKAQPLNVAPAPDTECRQVGHEHQTAITSQCGTQTEITGMEKQMVNISSLHISTVHIDNMHTGEEQGGTHDASCKQPTEENSEEDVDSCTHDDSDSTSNEPMDIGSPKDGASMNELKSQLFIYTKDNRKLKNRCAAQALRIKRLLWSVLALTFLVVVMIAGIAWGVYTHFHVVEQQMARYDTLHKDYELLSARFRNAIGDNANETDAMATASSVNDAAKKASENRSDEREASPSAKVSDGQNATASSMVNTKQGKATHQNVDEKPQSQPTDSEYDSDPRVRTGAYQIVGIEKTITLGKGQTLQSVSKAYLGSGMECYMEAVNKNSLREGDKVNIPKLKLKSKR